MGEDRRHASAPAENRLEGGVKKIKTSGEGAESRQYAARAVAHETAAADGTTVPGDFGDRVQMAGDFPDGGAGRRLMAENDGAERDLSFRLSPKAVRQNRVVVAGDPDPIPATLQGADGVAVFCADPPACLAIMKRVSERDDAVGSI